MVCADLEGLVSPHDQSDLAVLLVLQEAERTSTALLPFTLSIVILGEFEHLASHLENLLLRLLVGDSLNLLGELEDGFEVDILRFGGNLL